MISFSDHIKDKLLRDFSRLGVTEETVTDTIKSPDDLLYDPWFKKAHDARAIHSR